MAIPEGKLIAPVVMFTGVAPAVCESCVSELLPVFATQTAPVASTASAEGELMPDPVYVTPTVKSGRLESDG